jgi:hypothetical protein
VLKGRVGEIRRIADRITAERGVRYGRLRLLMLDEPAGDGAAGADASRCPAAHSASTRDATL